MKFPTHRISRALANWLNAVPYEYLDYLLLVPSNVDSTYVDPESRKDRGLKNFITGRLLMPIDLTFDWDNHVVRDAIKNFEPDYNGIVTDFYIRAFYAGYKGDPENLKDGYLKSTLLVKVFKHIFTSKSSAMNYVGPETFAEGSRKRQRYTQKKSTRPPVATLIGMKEATPRSIAYAAVMLHFCLLSAPHWMYEYDGFNYIALYDSIVDFFEVVLDKEESKALLKWWTQVVFGRQNPMMDPAVVAQRFREKAIAQNQSAANAPQTQLPVVGGDAAQVVGAATGGEGNNMIM
ncbi:hypothetical protein AAF712_016765 [Marasmius tenuissimus]|uniref:Uncharacterized protein n=1 Tax=Marasmius tenuissimus TaxID=585030 RepID=A0ABR2Z5Z5_9AGAR